MTNALKISLFSLIFIAFLPLKSFSQIYPWYGQRSYIDQMMVDRMNLRRMQERLRERRQIPPWKINPTQGSAPSVNLGNSTFISNGKRLLPNILADKQAKSPAEKKRLIEGISRNFDAIENRFRSLGRPVNNLAQATNALAQSIFLTYYGKEFNSRQSLGSMEKFDEYYSQDTEFQAMSNEDKQIFYETLLMATAMMIVSYQEGIAKKDERLINESKEIAARTSQNVFGVPVNKLKLTADGIYF